MGAKTQSQETNQPTKPQCHILLLPPYSLYFSLHHLLPSDVPCILPFDLLPVCVLLSRRSFIFSASKDFKLGVVAHLQPSTREAEAKELEASLGYTVNAKPVRAVSQGLASTKHRAMEIAQVVKHLW